MINLLEGTPGAGKSYEAVVYHVLPALRQGRKVITNLPLIVESFRVLYPDLAHLLEVRRSSQPILGRWDAEAANRGEVAFLVGEFEGEATSKTSDGMPCMPPPKDARLFGSVWDFFTTWRGDGNVGPLYVIDECHVSFPKPKARQKLVFTPDEVIQWFKISRHFGADVLLMTQRMGALDEDIAGLAEFHIRVRKASFLGRSDHYIRKVFAGYRGGEVSTDERKYETQYFPLYKSHTQGDTVVEAAAQDVAPAHLKWRRWSRIFMVSAALSSCWIGYKIFGATEKPKPVVVASAPAVVQAPKVIPQQAPVVPMAPASEPVKSEPPKSALRDPNKGPDPLENRAVHLAGCMSKPATGERVCSLAVSQNGMTIFQITDRELVALGYQFTHLDDCAAFLDWNGSKRAVVCDVPQVGMQVAGVKKRT